jgi:colicin import membrane protein
MSTRDELKREQRRFSVWVGIAAVAHAAIVASAVFMQLYYIRTHPPAKIVTVSLVSLPGTPGPSGGAKSALRSAPVETAPAKAPAKAEPPPRQKPPENIVPPKKVPEPVVVEKPPVPAKKELPSKTVVPIDEAKQRKQRLDAALEQLQKSTASQKPAAVQKPSSTVSNALEKLQKQVASEGSRGSSSGAGSPGGGGLYGNGGGASDPYKVKIAGIIQDNWAFSQQLLRTTAGMEVYVAINIQPNGSISQIRYDRKAPSEYLNNSVKQALKKSDPLPFPPRRNGTRDFWVGFVFTPEGIAQ